jgi:long-chain fatty acid transport protein
VSVAVFAGGFQLSDHSVTSLGRSHAGYGVVGDDASAVHFNPAGMSLLDKKHFQIGATFIKGEGKFTNIASTGNNTGAESDGSKNAVTPNSYLVLPINDQLHFGLGITSPFGTNTSYPDDFIGRFNGVDTQVKTVNINPSIAYKINERTSIGFGISYQKFEAILGGAILPSQPSSRLLIEGDSAKYGYNLGTMFRFDDDSRLGISYRSAIKHKIEGKATFSGFSGGAANNGSSNATADFTAPETAYIGYTKLLGDWRLSAGYRWTRWSRYQRLDIVYASQTTIDAQWSDVSTINIGADYTFSPKWVLRAGLAFDESPVPDNTRSVRTVDADRTWYSVGAGYKSSDNLQFDLAYRYISFANAPINQNIPRTGGALVGEYNDVNIHTLAAQMNYTF